MHTGLETDDVTHMMHVKYGQQRCDKGEIICILVKNSFVQLYHLKGQ